MKSTRMTLPADLAAAQRRFERWRAGGRPRRRLPPKFWDTAAALASKHGVYRVSKVLRLEYYKVKEKAAVRQLPREAEPMPAFVELAASPSAVLGSGGGYTVELIDNNGRRMTIRAASEVEPAALVAAFWSHEPCSR